MNVTGLKTSDQKKITENNSDQKTEVVYYAYNIHTAMDEFSIKEAIHRLVGDGYLLEGDQVAVAVSIFSQIPDIEAEGVEIIYLDAVVKDNRGRSEFFIPADEIIDKTRHQNVKSFFACNPYDRCVPIAEKSRNMLKQTILAKPEKAIDKPVETHHKFKVVYSDNLLTNRYIERYLLPRTAGQELTVINRYGKASSII